MRLRESDSCSQRHFGQFMDAVLTQLAAKETIIADWKENYEDLTAATLRIYCHTIICAKPLSDDLFERTLACLQSENAKATAPPI